MTTISIFDYPKNLTGDLAVYNTYIVWLVVMGLQKVFFLSDWICSHFILAYITDMAISPTVTVIVFNSFWGHFHHHFNIPTIHACTFYIVYVAMIVEKDNTFFFL